MNRKTTLALTGISVVAALTMTGCATSDASSDSSVLSIAWQAGTNPALDEIIAKFEQDNPDVTIKLSTAVDDDLQKTVRTQLLAGTAPDIFMVWPDSSTVLSVGTLAPDGFLAPLDDIAWAAAASEGAVDASSYDGTPYMATAAVDSSGAIYNMDTLGELGLSVPQTWSELLQFCGDARAAGRVAFGLGLQEVWTVRLVPSALVSNEIEDVAAFNASVLNGTFDFASSPEWATALEKQNEMIDAGCFNDSPVGTSMDNVVLPGVVNGEFLGTVSVGAHISVMMDPEAGDPDANFLMAPLPSGDDPEASRINVLYNAGIGINADAKNMDAAKKFVELWTSEWALNLTATQKSLLPSITNDEFVPAPSLTEVLALTDEGRVAGGDWMPGAKTFSAMTDGIQGVLLGKVTTQQALEAMQVAYLDGLK